MTRPPTAQLDWSLYVTCPKCDESNDLSEPQHDTEHDISGHIFNNRWERLKDWEVTCEHCNHEFKIEKVEY
jgi:hypothetical protein